jgi:hypothetical protein
MLHFHYYVWYRITGDPAPARGAVNALQHDVAKATGVMGRLLMRSEDPTTWMEVYENVVDAKAFERALAQATSAHGVPTLAPDGRHLERFVDAR